MRRLPESLPGIPDVEARITSPRWSVQPGNQQIQAITCPRLQVCQHPVHRHTSPERSTIRDFVPPFTLFARFTRLRLGGTRRPPLRFLQTALQTTAKRRSSPCPYVDTPEWRVEATRPVSGQNRLLGLKGCPCGHSTGPEMHLGVKRFPRKLSLPGNGPQGRVG